jgi:quercetin dioxygenase-like cupin family protein
MPGLDFIVKVGAAETRGTYSVFESVLPPGLPGPRLHVHTAEEGWYVIEGTLRFKVGEDEWTAEAGSFVLAPRGTRHSFSNIGQGPAKFLTIFTPPRDVLWTAVALLREAAGNAPMDVAKLNALYEQHGEDLAALAQ